MTAQSVELLLDAEAEAAVRAQWSLLHAAELPSEQRVHPSASHRPHITLYAADTISTESDGLLPTAVAGLELSVVLGGLLAFGPRGRSGSYVLVRQVVASFALLEVQRRVAVACGADPHGHFGDGRWTPHVTLARRMSAAQVGQALDALAPDVLAPDVLAPDVLAPDVLAPDRTGDLVAQITECRRWDPIAKRTWSLTT